jgi:hypothetical protein
LQEVFGGQHGRILDPGCGVQRGDVAYLGCHDRRSSLPDLPGVPQTRRQDRHPIFPCPLTLFAIALVAAAAPQVDKKVFALLLPWALMGLPKRFGALDSYEDCILLASGLSGLVELSRNWKPRGQQRAGSCRV